VVVCLIEETRDRREVADVRNGWQVRLQSSTCLLLLSIERPRDDFRQTLIPCHITSLSIVYFATMFETASSRSPAIFQRVAGMLWMSDFYLNSIRSFRKVIYKYVRARETEVFWTLRNMAQWWA
jgi:hypothetical protein